MFIIEASMGGHSKSGKAKHKLKPEKKNRDMTAVGPCPALRRPRSRSSPPRSCVRVKGAAVVGKVSFAEEPAQIVWMPNRSDLPELEELARDRVPYEAPHGSPRHPGHEVWVDCDGVGCRRAMLVSMVNTTWKIEKDEEYSIAYCMLCWRLSRDNDAHRAPGRDL